MICQSGVGQEIKNPTYWHRTLLLIVSQVTGSHMPAGTVAFGAARVLGVHLGQGTRSILSWMTKTGTRPTLTWKPAAGTVISWPGGEPPLSPSLGSSTSGPPPQCAMLGAPGSSGPLSLLLGGHRGPELAPDLPTWLGFT